MIALQLKLASRPVYAQDIRPQMPDLQADAYVRAVVHASYFSYTHPALQRGSPHLSYPLRHIDPERAFYGFDQWLIPGPDWVDIPSTKLFVATVGWTAGNATRTRTVDTVTGEEADVERPMTGGRLTAGVVQVGDTVRRPASAASRFVARLLTCLAEKGFDGCPRHLGWDEEGRDVLSFLPGHVPARWRRFNDTQIRAAAVMLRRMHDATRDLAAEIGSGEVICHHDPGPNNTVFRQGHPVAFIDFDFAAPGQPIEDVAYMGWSWCLSSRLDRGPATEQARQVRVLADAYGLGDADRQRLPAAIRQRLMRNEMFWRNVLQGPRLPHDRHLRATETLEWTRREFRHVETHQAILMAAVSR